MPYTKNLGFTPLMTMLHLSFILLLLALFTPAQAAEPASGFDHFSTGFPLIGRHEFIDCSECHIAGQFKGTPMECGLCHNNIRAPGKHTQHVPSSNFCDDCHTERTWLGARFDHSTVTETCSSCHNGVIATGKHPTHIQTTFECDECHNTFTWLGARFDHSTVTETCSSCHDGVIATGKHPTHILTTPACEDCHNTITFDPVTRVDHTSVIGNCSSCHDGDQDADHDPITEDCGNSGCHTTESWSTD